MNNSSLFLILQRMRKPFIVIIITYTIAILGLVLIKGLDSNGNEYTMSIFEAFYFVSYMATTIGFGELPYEFTPAQRLWVTFSIYLTVLGWFYSIGSLVSLFQDKLFLQEIEKSKFRRQIKNLKDKFIIILGYNEITSKIIQNAINSGIRTVVIEKDKNKINELLLESFTPTVPVLLSDNYNIKALEEAGIKKINCKAVVSLFEDDAMNLRISLSAKLLNKNLRVIAKATTNNSKENLKDVDVEVIVNPFSIISSEIKMALSSPHLFKLERWLYKISALTQKTPTLPDGKYIICGYGRMGENIYKCLKSFNMDVSLVELNEQRVMSFLNDDMSNIILANADDKGILLEAGIKDAQVIISATNNDTTNLSILATAKKLNPNITTIVRENEMEDFLLFKSAKIDHIFMPSRIIINKTSNAIITPLSDIFIKMMIKKDEQWAKELVKNLIENIDENPLVYQLNINERKTPMLSKHIKEGKTITFDILRKSLYNQEQNNNLIPLLLKRENEYILLPSFHEQIKQNDTVLFACDKEAKEQMLYICLNYYEFYYALNGKEKSRFIKGKK